MADATAGDRLERIELLKQMTRMQMDIESAFATLKMDMASAKGTRAWSAIDMAVLLLGNWITPERRKVLLAPAVTPESNTQQTVAGEKGNHHG